MLYPQALILRKKVAGVTMLDLTDEFEWSSPVMDPLHSKLTSKKTRKRKESTLPLYNNRNKHRNQIQIVFSGRMSGVPHPLLVVLDRLWVRTWEPALGGCSPGQGCWEFPGTKWQSQDAHQQPEGTASAHKQWRCPSRVLQTWLGRCLPKAKQQNGFEKSLVMF